jgi:predicted MPP superfamily phosphohydrolase
MMRGDATALLILIFSLPICSSVFLTWFVLCRAARRFGFLVGSNRTWVERKWIIAPSASILGVYAISISYGYFIERQWIEVTKTEIGVNEAVLGYDRFRIIHLSDLHFRAFGRRESRLLELIHEVKPHLILITGDFADCEEGESTLVRVLRAVKVPPFGIFGVEGNNDNDQKTTALLRAAGLDVLQDDVRLIEKEGKSLCLVGQTFSSKIPLMTLLHNQKRSATTIFMHHTPDALDQLSDLEADEHVDLFLCGHTHGGQVCLPFWGAVITESKYHKRYERGLYDVKGVPMYVNRGIGTTRVPIRFLARPEVAVIDLVHR